MNDETTGDQTHGDQMDGLEPPGTHFELGAVIAGWQRAPTNPTLNVQAGRRYRVTFENLDGATHDFTIVDADGDEILGTETIDVRDGTRSVTFTASEEMDQYVCSIHPESMRGDVDVGGQTADGNSDGNRTAGNGTDGNQTDGDDGVDTHFELGAVVGGWQGYSPFDGETNPTLDMTVDDRYRVTWKNLDGATHDFAIVDADGSEVLGTDSLTIRSGTRSLRFTASQEMDQYVCTFHPESMRGDVNVERDVIDIEELFVRGPLWMVGWAAAAIIAIVLGFAYLLSRYVHGSGEQ